MKGKIPVDLHLVEISGYIVSGLDRTIKYLPQNFINCFESEPKVLEYMDWAVSSTGGNSIRNSRYWGSRNDDGTFGFNTISRKGEVGYEVNLTEDQAREIVSGKMTEIEVEYE